MTSRSLPALKLAIFFALAATFALSSTTIAGAMTFDQTEQAVTGISNSKWTVGDSGQTYGTNCSTAILGSSYPEVMEMAYSMYGGKPGSIRVNDQYWAMIHLAVTGNPCPKGSDIIPIDLTMPPGTSFDATRPIRCFSTGIHDSSNFYESTNENWDMRPIGINAYGRTCPTGLTPSASGHGVGLDYRGLASGQNFLMYVPVKSTQTLVGMGNADHRFVWIVSPTLAYDFFGTQTWANVFPAGSSSPYIYFTREPSVIPYWDSTRPAGQQNLVEMFANLYSNYQPGTFCYRLYEGPTATGSPVLNCVNFSGTIDASSDIWFAKGTGTPHGGAVSFYMEPADYGKTFTIQWYFTPSSGPTVYSTPVSFKALSGPDDDADGIPNDGTDECPSDKGDPPTGCPLTLRNIADPDGDGVIGAADKCPNLGQIGASNGCPTLTAKFGKLPSFKRSKLAKGVSFPVTCSLDTPAKADLVVKAAVAKKLKLKVKKGAKTVSIGSAKASCKANGGAKLKLKLSSKAKRPVSKSKRAIAATINLTFSPTGGVAAVTTSKSVKLK